MRMRNVLLGALFFSVMSAGAAHAAGQKAILVTGASSGIGRMLTEQLAADGYFVYATARKPEDLAELAKIRNVQAIKLDVTKPEEVAAALEVVKKGGRGLYGLVNNAGIATGFPILEGNDAEFDLCMQVNVYGPYRMTKAFGPLVVADKGRIVNIGSIAGLFSWNRGSAYSMSKHAVEAFTDSLGDELEPTGVKVAVVEPGNYNSDIGKNAVGRGLNLPPERVDRSRYKQPDEVTAAVRHALFDAAPRRRYLVVPNPEEAEVTIRAQLSRLAQLNESQPYKYERAKLIEMLDAAIAEETRAPEKVKPQ
jgi:NAD(P)-dependent dehydrogenase (short-subunit alcohol dehydrogenase family)